MCSKVDDYLICVHVFVPVRNSYLQPQNRIVIAVGDDVELITQSNSKQKLGAVTAVLLPGQGAGPDGYHRVVTLLPCMLPHFLLQRRAQLLLQLS